MRIWLITIGEPLPIDGPNERLYRTGMIAQLLSMQGHQVLWWTSKFDHSRKRHREFTEPLLKVNNNLTIKLLETRGYNNNISINRIIDHYQLASAFSKKAPLQVKPDIILCSLPTLNLSKEAVIYGCKWNVPVVIDIRDLWPDIFIEVIPKFMIWIANIVLQPAFRKVQMACSGATAIFGITPAFVEWGLEYARREKNCLDQDFPLAYSEEIPDQDRKKKAEIFWKELGLLADSQFIVCFFGNMSDNVLQLQPIIEVATKLRERSNYEFKFVLCGNGSSFSHYQKMARDCENIIMPGRVGSSEIWVLMRLSSVGILPYRSRNDFMKSLPNKSIEYLSAGLPIISSLKGLLQELLETNNCGITYKEGTPEQLAEILIRLYEEPETLKKMSENALSLYRERFVAEKVYSEMIDHLEFICSEYNKGGE